MLGTILSVFCLLFSLLLTWLLLKYAFVLQLIDIPNNRNVHDKAMPRGGGFAIILSLSIVMIYSYYYEWLSIEFIKLYMLACFIGLLGLADDFASLSSFFRLIIQIGISIIAASILLYNSSSVNIFDSLNVPIFIAFPVTIIFLTWMTNLYNFMDGIDGIAGLQALLFSLTYSVLLLFSGNTHLMWVFVFICSAILGFLCWNWPPAKIFMGDSGSSFLGFLFGVLILLLERDNIIPLGVGLILFAIFITDTTVTLLQRLFNKENIFEAHNKHRFQQLARALGSHFSVLQLMFIFFSFWLLPLAIFSFIFEHLSILLVFLAYLPLLIVCIMLFKSYLKLIHVQNRLKNLVGKVNLLLIIYKLLLKKLK